MQDHTDGTDFPRIVAALPQAAFEDQRGLRVAHTDPAGARGEWWHVTTPDGKYVGSANSAALLPLVLDAAA